MLIYILLDHFSLIKQKKLEIFNCIHSIDREKLVNKINDIFEYNEELKSKNHKFLLKLILVMKNKNLE